MNRRWDLDALRGLMLIAMTLTHLPTRFSDPTGQPLGFVSAAEGFVLLSAYMAGLVYTQREQKRGEEAMREAFLKRAFKIYVCQAALLLFLFTVIAVIGLWAGQPAVTNMMSFYLERPLAAFFAGLLLIYSPPLLDILPMYILFMLLSPLLLLHGLQHGWRGLMAGSALFWLAAQFGLGEAGYNTLVAVTGMPVPKAATGAFDLFAWQFIWMLGLWMGSSSAVARPDTPPLRFPPWMVRLAVFYALAGFVWRHLVGHTPFPPGLDLNILFDKWHLGPLRLLNLFALLVLVMHFGPWLVRHAPRWKPLEVLGSASLPVFCAHLVLALLALALLGVADPERPVVIDLAILGVTFASLYAVALVSQALDQRAAAMKAGLKARQAAWVAKRRPAAVRVGSGLAQASPSLAAGPGGKE